MGLRKWFYCKRYGHRILGATYDKVTGQRTFYCDDCGKLLFSYKPSRRYKHGAYT